MDPSREDIGQDVDSINNLDTAKMTLRWALERLRTLESKSRSWEKQAQAAQSTLLAQSQASRERELIAGNREDYYKRIEELLSESCKGRLDLSDLIRRETEVEGLERQLAGRRGDLEREFIERKDLLERRFKKMQAEVEIQAVRQAEGVEQNLNERHKQLDKSYLAREMAIRATEHQLDTRQKSFDDMTRRLEQAYTDRKTELESQYDRLKEEMREKLRTRIEDWERQQSEHAALERSHWERERSRLLKQAEGWEFQTRDLLEKIRVLENEKVEAQQKLVESAQAVDERIQSLDQEYRVKEQGLAARYRDRFREKEAVERELRDRLENLREEVKAEHQELYDSLRDKADEAGELLRVQDEKFRLERKKMEEVFEARMNAALADLRKENEELARRTDDALQRMGTAKQAAEHERRKGEQFTARLKAAEDQARAMEAALEVERAKTAEWMRAVELARKAAATLKEAQIQRDVKRTREHQEALEAQTEDFKAQYRKIIDGLKAEHGADRNLLVKKADAAEAALKTMTEKAEREGQFGAQMLERIKAADAQVSALEKALAEERANKGEWIRRADLARKELSALKEVHLDAESKRDREFQEKLEAQAEEFRSQYRKIIDGLRAQHADDNAALVLKADSAQEHARTAEEGADRVRLENVQMVERVRAADLQVAAMAEALDTERRRAAEIVLALEAAKRGEAELRQEQIRADSDRAVEHARSLEKQAEEFRAQKAGVLKELRAAEAAAESERLGLERAQERVAAAERRAAELEAAVAAERARIAELSEALEKAKRAETALHEAHLRDDAEREQKHVGKLRAFLEAMSEKDRGRAAGWEKRREELEAENERVRGKLKKQADDLKDRERDMERRLRAEFEARLTEMQKRVVAAEDELHRNQEPLLLERLKSEEMQKKVHAAEAQARALEQTLAAERIKTRSWIAKSENAEETLRKAAAEHEEHLRKESERSRQRAARMDEFLAELREKEKELEERFERRRKELEWKIEEKRAAVEAEAATLRTDREKLEGTIRAEVGGQIADLQKAIMAGDEKLRIALVPLESERRRTEQLEARLETADRQIRALEDALTVERNKNADWVATSEATLREIANMKEQHLSSDAEKDQEHTERMKKFLAEMRDKERNLEAAWSLRHRELEESYRRRNSESRRARSADMDTLRQRETQLESEYEKMKQELRAEIERQLRETEGKSRELARAKESLRKREEEIDLRWKKRRQAFSILRRKLFREIEKVLLKPGKDPQ